MSDYPKHLNRYATSADVARQTDSRYDNQSNGPAIRLGQLIPVADEKGSPLLIVNEDHEAAVRAQYPDVID